MTTPPEQDPISQLYLSDTFYTWYKKTNDLITKVNPIEVYSITGGTQFGQEGITLSDNGDGNWTIGYVLPETIPNPHIFTGDITFGAGVSGEIVNTFNGSTGAVQGVSTISHDYTPDGNGNLASVPMIINGVTATTGGVMSLDGTDIPNTISSITGPAGYVLAAGANAVLDRPTRLFIGEGPTAQDTLLIDTSNKQIAINTTTIDPDGYIVNLLGGDSGGIKISSNALKANDIQLDGHGVIKSELDLFLGCGEVDSQITFMSGETGATAGICTQFARFTDDISGHTQGILEIGTHIGSVAKTAIRLSSVNSLGANDISMHGIGNIHADNGMRFYTDEAKFEFINGESSIDANDRLIAFDKSGAIGLEYADGSYNYGDIDQALISKGSGQGVEWGSVAASSSGGSGGGANIHMFPEGKDMSTTDQDAQVNWGADPDGDPITGIFGCGQLFGRNNGGEDADGYTTFKTYDMQDFGVPSDANYVIVNLHTYAVGSGGDEWQIYGGAGADINHPKEERQLIVSINARNNSYGGSSGNRDYDGTSNDTNTVWIPIGQEGAANGGQGKIFIYKINPSVHGPDYHTDLYRHGDGSHGVILGYVQNGPGNGGANTASKIVTLEKPLDLLTGNELTTISGTPSGSVAQLSVMWSSSYIFNDYASSGAPAYNDGHIVEIDLSSYSIPIDATHIKIRTFTRSRYRSHLWMNYADMSLDDYQQAGEEATWLFGCETNTFHNWGHTEYHYSDITVPLNAGKKIILGFGATYNTDGNSNDTHNSIQCIIEGYIVPASGGPSTDGSNIIYFKDGPKFMNGTSVPGDHFIQNRDANNNIVFPGGGPGFGHLSDVYNLFGGSLGIPTNADFVILECFYEDNDGFPPHNSAWETNHSAYYLAGDAQPNDTGGEPINWAKKYLIASGDSMGGSQQVTVPIDSTGLCRFGITSAVDDGDMWVAVRVLGYIVNGRTTGDVGIDMRSLDNPVKLDDNVSVGTATHCLGGTIINTRDDTIGITADTLTTDNTFNVTESGLPNNVTHIMLSAFTKTGNRPDYRGSVLCSALPNFDPNNSVEILAFDHKNDTGTTQDGDSYFNSVIVPVSQSNDNYGDYSIRIKHDPVTEMSSVNTPDFDYNFQIDGYISSGGVSSVNSLLRTASGESVAAFSGTDTHPYAVTATGVQGSGEGDIHNTLLSGSADWTILDLKEYGFVNEDNIEFIASSGNSNYDSPGVGTIDKLDCVARQDENDKTIWYVTARCSPDNNSDWTRSSFSWFASQSFQSTASSSSGSGGGGGGGGAKVYIPNTSDWKCWHTGTHHTSTTDLVGLGELNINANTVYYITGRVSVTDSLVFGDKPILGLSNEKYNSSTVVDWNENDNNIISNVVELEWSASGSNSNIMENMQNISNTFTLAIHFDDNIPTLSDLQLWVSHSGNSIGQHNRVKWLGEYYWHT